MFSKILVPLDGSELAEHAMEVAVGIAQKFGSEVFLLRVAVAEPALVGLPGMAPRPYETFGGNAQRDQDEAESYLYSIKLRWFGRGVAFHAQVLSGTAPELIVETARAQEADLIVMSTHGRSGLSRLIYGSVAEAVLRGAHVPVLLVPVKT